MRKLRCIRNYDYVCVVLPNVLCDKLTLADHAVHPFQGAGKIIPIKDWKPYRVTRIAYGAGATDLSQASIESTPARRFDNIDDIKVGRALDDFILTPCMPVL